MWRLLFLLVALISFTCFNIYRLAFAVYSAILNEFHELRCLNEKSTQTRSEADDAITTGNTVSQKQEQLMITGTETME